jgi:NADH:ubiquinone oxidoreductase subunit B-like Fe-S oxidoreductase
MTTVDNPLPVSVYVPFRSPHPDEATVENVLRDLQDNIIDVNHLVELKANHCQQAQSSTERVRFQ